MVDLKLNTERSEESLGKYLCNMKIILEKAIRELEYTKYASDEIVTATKSGKKFENGLAAKESLIRSQNLIYHLHDFVKQEFQDYGVSSDRIFPPLNKNAPEKKVAGYFKQKDQDVCVIPKFDKDKLEPKEINWGPLKNRGLVTEYGIENEDKILVTNIRSQMSSVGKNIDTLFERMIAESYNLHYKFPNMIIGELYLIPVYEYSSEEMKSNKVSFNKNKIDIEKYIRFFFELNKGDEEIVEGNLHKYNRAALLVVDFNKEIPKIYTSTQELIEDKIVKDDFDIELNTLSPLTFVYDLINMYLNRYPNYPIISIVEGVNTR